MTHTKAGNKRLILAAAPNYRVAHAKKNLCFLHLFAYNPGLHPYRFSELGMKNFALS